jgi:hypothetical protein
MQLNDRLEARLEFIVVDRSTHVRKVHMHGFEFKSKLRLFLLNWIHKQVVEARLRIVSMEVRPHPTGRVLSKQKTSRLKEEEAARSAGCLLSYCQTRRFAVYGR